MSTDAETSEDEDAPEGAAAAPSRKAMGIWTMTFGLLFLSVVIPWGLWFSMRDDEIDAEERLQQSFKHLEDKEYRFALNMAMPLLNSENPDPRTGGSVEYIIGMVAYRDANLMRVPLNKARYEMAVSYLNEAHTKSLRDEHLDPWNYTLGMSLFKLDRISEALPHLETAFQKQGATSPEICLALAKCYLNPNTKLLGVADLSEIEREQRKKEKADRCVAVALKAKSITPDQLKQAKRLEIDLAAVQKKSKLAAKLLVEFRAKYTDGKNIYHTPEISDLIILEGKILLEDKQYKQAIKVLSPIVDDASLYGQEKSRKAHYIIGYAYENLKDIDNAIQHYKNAESLDNSDEALASSLRHADLLRRHKAQHELALGLYTRALNRISSAEDFTNPWISLSVVKQHFQSGWEEWIEEKQFGIAIQLSTRLTPLFPQDKAEELTALATSRWAESLQQKYDESTTREKRKLKPTLLSRWIQAGDAYQRLANSRRTQGNYPEALWDAAFMYRKGQSYKNAYHMMNKFILLEPLNLLPTALVAQGEILMDMDAFDDEDRLEEAIGIFQKVLEFHRKNQISFTAQLNLGKAYLEQNKLELAMETWGEILASPNLAPAAKEWKQAQYLYGKTLFYLSQKKDLDERKARDQELLDKADKISKERAQHIDNAITKLDEYLLRANKEEKTAEANWILAQALQVKAEFPKRLYKTAETDNAQLQLRNEIQAALKRSNLIYENLRVTLKPLFGDDQLNVLEERILKDSFFQPCHNTYQLGQYDPSGKQYRKAIIDYRNAANFYSQDPIVLLAYYQMANCYDLLKRPSEARSQLEQAKVILQQLSEKRFTQETSNYSFVEWKDLLDRAIQIQQAKAQDAIIR